MPDNIRIVCGVEGYEDCWIEYDASRWGLGVYAQLWGELKINQVVTEFIPRYSVAWYMHDDDGVLIVHPGPGATSITWQSVWNQFGIESSRFLFVWLWSSSLAAINEAMTLSPKSVGGGSDDGTRVQENAERRESVPAG